MFRTSCIEELNRLNCHSSMSSFLLIWEAKNQQSNHENQVFCKYCMLTAQAHWSLNFAQC